MKHEQWKPVKGFETYYMVSNTGYVKSIPNPNRYRPNQKCGILNMHLSKFGYYQVTLTIFGKRHLKRVNRLVAEVFIKNPENKPCVNHKNGVKTDNMVNNLEWATYSENETHSYDILKKDIRGIKKTYKNDINQKCKKIICNENNTQYNSIKEAANDLFLERANISAQIKGRLKKTGGFTFKLL